MKPGIKTSEFWVALVAQVVGILALIGVFTPEQADTLQQALTALAGAIMQALSAFGYAVSRGSAKSKGEG